MAPNNKNVEDSDNEEDDQEVDLALQNIAENNVMMNAEHLLTQLFNSPPIELPSAESGHSSSGSSTDQLGGQHSTQEDSTDPIGQGSDETWFSRDGDVFYSWAELKRFVSDNENADLQQKLDLVEAYGDR